MRGKRFKKEQIIAVLKEAEAGISGQGYTLSYKLPCRPGFE